MPDIEEFLQPISEDAPSGEDIRYEVVYDEIRDARDSDPLADPPVVPDFREARRLAEGVLKESCKHLQVAAWLAEAWTNLEGMSGLRAGVDLQRRLLEEFWETVFPEIDEGDLEFRAAPLEWMAGNYLGPSLLTVPITGTGLTTIEFQQSRQVGYDADVEGDYEGTEARNALIAEGKITADDFDEAVDGTPKAFYKTLMADIEGTLTAIDALESLTDEQFGTDIGPSFRSLRGSIDDLKRIVRPILDKKLEEDPDPVEVEVVDDDTGLAPTDEDGGVPIEPVSKKDAGVRIAAAARFLREDDPFDPAPYLMVRGLRWGELRKGGGGVEPRLLAAPPTATRTRLKSLLLDGKWPELLANAEEVMATPFGRGWLDLQRYVFTALEGLGPQYEAVEKSVKGALRSLLIDLPELPDLTLMDDTPTANRETQRWLAEEGLLGPLTEEEQAAMEAGGSSGPTAGRDVVERAKDRVRAGQPQKAIEMLMQAADQSGSLRGRTLHRAEAAGVMVQAGLAPVAEPILREIMARIEEFRLEEWEGAETVAEPMAMLYRCIDQMGGDEHEKQELYLRVCRLDPMQAMVFAQEAEAAAEQEVSDGGFEES